MFERLLGGWLMAACLLAPSPLGAQTSEGHESYTLGHPRSTVGESAHKPDLQRAEQMIFEMTNQFRSNKGRRELRVNPALSPAAHYFADYMARTDKYGHQADGRAPAQRMASFGYHYCLAAENIAGQYNSEGFTTESLAESFFSGWKHSPPHRRNLLDPDLYEIGVAVAYSPHSGRYYAVQDFGRPKSKAIAFTITNNTNTTVQYKVGDKTYSIEPHYTMTHERCRPAALMFQKSGEEEGDVFHPRTGAHYVTLPGGPGGYTVEREQGAGG
jgi:uncharacterized protein YkwD